MPLRVGAPLHVTRHYDYRVHYYAPLFFVISTCLSRCRYESALRWRRDMLQLMRCLRHVDVIIAR